LHKKIKSWTTPNFHNYWLRRTLRTAVSPEPIMETTLSQGSSCMSIDFRRTQKHKKFEKFLVGIYNILLYIWQAKNDLRLGSGTTISVALCWKRNLIRHNYFLKIQSIFVFGCVLWWSAFNWMRISGAILVNKWSHRVYINVYK